MTPVERISPPRWYRSTSSRVLIVI